MKSVVSFFRGIWILLKKDIHLYWNRMVSILVLICLLTVGCYVALSAVTNSANSDGDKRMCLALYDKEPSSLANAAVEMIASKEEIKEMFTIATCDSEKQVLDGMKAGIYDAALIFEEGYFDKILDGGDSAISLLISDKLTAANDVVTHFAHTGERLIKIAEGGIEATYADIKSDPNVEKPGKISNEITVEYALEIFGMPTEAYTVEVVPTSSNGVDVATYYLICFTVFLLILCEVIFFPYTAGDCAYSMLRRIRSYRISNASIVIEKTILPFFIRTVLFSVILFFASSSFSVDFSFESILSALLAIALMSLLFSALSSLLSQTALGISIIFALSVAGLVLCGGLIPSSMLPYTVTKIGAFTPSGLCTGLFAPVFGGFAHNYDMPILTVVTVILIALASLYMRRICERGGGER